MGTANQIVDMGMRQLRSSDLGDRRDDYAPLQAAADHLVLGRLSDGHPLQRHFGPAIATQLGLGSYRSAWLLCGKLRQSMVAPGRTALAGLVEIEMLIVGAVEVQNGGAGPGRIRLSKVSDYSADSLHPFIAGNLAPGATAKTDGWSAYPGAPSIKHYPHVVGKMAAHIVLPWVHRIFSNL